MLNDLRKEIAAASFERTSGPMYGTFLVSWLLWNWEIIYITLFVDNKHLTENKFNLIVGYINWFDSLLFPIVSTFILVWYMPIISNKVYKKYLKFKKEREDEKRKTENNTLLTLEQSREIRENLVLMEEENHRLIERFDIKEKNYKETILKNNEKIEKLENVKLDFEKSKEKNENFKDKVDDENNLDNSYNEEAVTEQNNTNEVKSDKDKIDIIVDDSLNEPNHKKTQNQNKHVKTYKEFVENEYKKGTDIELQGDDNTKKAIKHNKTSVANTLKNKFHDSSKDLSFYYERKMNDAINGNIQNNTTNSKDEETIDTNDTDVSDNTREQQSEINQPSKSQGGNFQNTLENLQARNLIKEFNGIVEQLVDSGLSKSEVKYFFREFHGEYITDSDKKDNFRNVLVAFELAKTEENNKFKLTEKGRAFLIYLISMKISSTDE